MAGAAWDTGSAVTAHEFSPLREIERRVQARAKDISLDMGGDDGGAKLRALIDDEVAAWSADYRRGLRDFDLNDPEAVADRAFRNLAGYGPLEPLLADDDVWEIMVNAPDQIFVKRHRGPSSYHDEAFNDDDHVVRTLTKILDDANASHRKLDPAEGLQDAQLDTGARLHIVHGDVGRDGHVLVNIRKFTGVAYRLAGRVGAARHARRPGGRFPAGLREGPPVHGVLRRSRVGQDHHAVLLRLRAGPEPAGGDRRGSVRGRPSSAERGVDAGPARPPGAPGSRSPPARRRLPPHGPRRGHSGRSEGQRGAMFAR